MLLAAVAVGGLVLCAGWARRPVPRWAASDRSPDASTAIGGGALAGRIGRRGLVAAGSDAERSAAAVEAELAVLRSELAAGASVVAALAVLADGGGPWAQPSDAAVDAVARGAGLDAALAGWIDACGDPVAALAGHALGLAGRTGGSHVAAIDVATLALRERTALAREVRALSSQARASALVLVVTPLAFAVVVVALDPRVRAIYLGPVGLACALVGLVLDGIGAAWLAGLVRRAR
ncbi:MAG: type II secretion system F family protein [Acidimicrobiales bacterium]